MKKVLFFVGLLLLCLCVGSVSAMSGNGTIDNPWIITTPDDLQALSGTGLAGYGANAYYELGADIDMSGVSFTPIGTSSLAFSGYFDGKNHTISNLVVDLSTTSNTGGVFYNIYGGTVSNIIFKNAYGTFLYYCGFVCCYISNAVVENCVFDGCYLTGSGVAMICKSIRNVGSINNCIVINSIINSPSGTVDGGSSAICFGLSSLNSMAQIDGCQVINTYIINSNLGSNAFNGGILARVDGGNYTISNCIVSKSTLVNTNSRTYLGGIYGKPFTGIIVSNCTVSDCVLIGASQVSGVGN